MINQVINTSSAKHLKIINELSFTNREIDIMAFVRSGHSAKKMACFLNISTKTVTNKNRNIMIKIERT